MSHFYRKKLNAQGKYINPPVHAKRKVIKRLQVRSREDAPILSYKFDRGPLKETTSERLARMSNEADARYYERQAEKEANKMFKRKTAEDKRMIKEAKLKARHAVKKVLLTKEEKRLKWNAYQNARNARLRDEAKNTSFVITITITDPNKS